MDKREALQKNIRRKIKEYRVSKWSPDAQPNIYELDKFLRKSGYRLTDLLPHEKGTPELVIEPIKLNYSHPNIEHDIEENEFFIEVKDHGLLILSDLEEIVKGYQNAMAVVTYLESLDLSKLEIDD